MFSSIDWSTAMQFFSNILYINIYIEQSSHEMEEKIKWIVYTNNPQLEVIILCALQIPMSVTEAFLSTGTVWAWAEWFSLQAMKNMNNDGPLAEEYSAHLDKLSWEKFKNSSLVPDPAGCNGILTAQPLQDVPWVSSHQLLKMPSRGTLETLGRRVKRFQMPCQRDMLTR